MASPKAANPGRTARFYRKNKASREKHNRDNNSGSGGKHAHTKEYKRTHARERRRLKPAKGQDVIRTKRGWASQSMKINRGER